MRRNECASFSQAGQWNCCVKLKANTPTMHRSLYAWIAGSFMRYTTSIYYKKLPLTFNSIVFLNMFINELKKIVYLHFSISISQYKKIFWRPEKKEVDVVELCWREIVVCSILSECYSAVDDKFYKLSL